VSQYVVPASAYAAVKTSLYRNGQTGLSHEMVKNNNLFSNLNPMTSFEQLNVGCYRINVEPTYTVYSFNFNL